MKGYVQVKERVTAKDVAKKAGVSQPTVSRVLNNHPHVKEATKKKVLQAIEELGFTPDEIARSMISKKTGTIGLIVGDISNPFYAESAKDLIENAQQVNYDVIISNTNHADEQVEKAIQTLLGKRVDGMIIAGINRENISVQELYEQGFPVVLYNSMIESEKSNFIALNNKKGAHLAVKHLVDLGHQKIAYIAGTSKYLTTEHRLIGYKEALQTYGLSYDDRFVYKGQFTYDGIRNFAIELLSKSDHPTAFVSVSDQMAIAVIDAAAQLGLKIGKEVSIIGFDNIAIAANPYIGLTTISQRKERMAPLAIEKLVSLIEKSEGSLPIQIMLEPELIVRNTTGRNLKDYYFQAKAAK